MADLGTYGTYTGILRWYDATNEAGHLLVLKDGELQTDITGDYWASGATGYDEGSGFWLDRQFTPGTTIAVGEPMGLLLALTYAEEVSSPATGVTRLFFGNSAGNKVTWDGTDLVIVGNVTATSGSFGGWTINSTYLAKDTGVNATSAGMAPLDYPFYSGATYANRASATFRVNNAGAFVAENATISGTVSAASGNMVMSGDGLTLHDMLGASIITPSFGVGRIQNTLVGGEAFDLWSVVGTVSVTADAVESPSGADSFADQIDMPADGDGIYAATHLSPKLANGANGVFSVWIKAPTDGALQVEITTVTTGPHELANTTLTVTTNWQRVAVPYANSTGADQRLQVKIYRYGTSQLACVYLWGAQVANDVSIPGVYTARAFSGASPYFGTLVRGALVIEGIDDNGDANIVAVGHAWSALPTGQYTAVVGPQAGDAATAGYLIAVGSAAGKEVTGLSTIALGVNSGYQASGEYAVYIGNSSGRQNSHNHVLLFGREASATAANQIVFGGHVLPDTTLGDYLELFGGGGVTKASPPSSFRINSTGGSGTDIAGSDLKLAGGIATGNAASGKVIFQTGAVGSTGDTPQMLTDRMWVNEDGSVDMTQWLQMPEISDPSAPATNYARLYVKDNGSGKTQLCVRFPTGAVQVLATEP